MSLVQTALAASLPATAAFGLTEGAVVHWLVRPYEIDHLGWQIVFGALGSLAATAAVYASVGGYDVSEALKRTTVVAVSFFVGHFMSILLYRAFFHRLRRFPGPYMAKLSRFYFTRRAYLRLQAMVDVQELHTQYGDVVRIGPRELSINRESAIKAIYGPLTRCTRSSLYSQVSIDGTKVSVAATRDLLIHKNRKKAWERGLSFRALETYVPRITEKAELLIKAIEKNRNGPIDMELFAMFYGFDAMGDVGLSKDFHMLERGETDAAIQGLHGSMTTIGILGTVPWLLSMLVKIPWAAGSYATYAQWCYDQMAEKRRVFEQEKIVLKDQDPRDVISWLLRAEDEHDISAPPSEQAFQEDARLLIVAGSDTSSLCLTNTIYYLIRNPHVYQKLQAILRGIFPGGDADWNYDAVKNIDYIEHILHESLRLRPPVPGGLLRVTPPEGLKIDELFIPGDVIVSVPTWTIHRDERHWDAPLEFRPERWETMSIDKAPWIPFTRGQHICPGRHLSYLELRTVLTRIALRYNLSLAPGFDPLDFENNFKDTFTAMNPALPVIFTPV